MKQRRALVIGGSLGGLFAANMLRTIGWDVSVFERVDDDLSARGAGIATHAELFDVMRQVGAAIDDTIGVELNDRICLDRDGHVTHGRRVPQYMSAWARVYRPLKDLLPQENYRFSARFEGFEQDEDGVTAFFADGSRERGDLLIGADGIRSTVRAQLFPDVQPIYGGYVAWRGTVPESEVPAENHGLLFGNYIFSLPEGEMMLSYPMPGRNNDNRVGYRDYNFVWYRPTDEAAGLSDLCTDASGHKHGVSIPPPLIRPELTARLRDDATRLLAPQIADIVHRAKQPFFQAIFDLESSRLVGGRVVLLGDAAFVARPHVGAGVTKAALDAESLAACLEEAGDDLGNALAKYNAERILFGQRMVNRARMLGAYLQAQLKPMSQRSGNELHQEPEVVMREIGAPVSGIEELSSLRRGNRTAAA